MFLRKQTKNGKTYYALVRTFREDGKVKQESTGLGSPPSLKWVNITNEVKEKLYKTYSELTHEYEEFKIRVHGKPESMCSHSTCRAEAVIHGRTSLGMFGSKKVGWCEKHWKSHGKKKEAEAAADQEKQSKYHSDSGMSLKEPQALTPHFILGLSEEATPDEAKKRYRELAKLLHPDRGGDEKLFGVVTQTYQSIVKEGVYSKRKQ